MSESKHTHGPWRWEFNDKHKSVNLVGGRPMFDLTVMDFSRWGMSNAVPRFRDTSVDGMNLMDRLCDKPEWIEPVPGREHHKQWCQLVTHPDARLISSAPDLLDALQSIVKSLADQDDEGMIEHAETMIAARAAIAKATGQKQ